MNHRKGLYFPIFMDLTDKKVLAEGNDVRIADILSMFSGFAGNIVAVAEQPCGELEKMEADGMITILRKSYDREDLYGADYVIARTGDPEWDRDIYAACKCLGIPVHVCEDPSRCDFFFTDGAPQTEERKQEEKTDPVNASGMEAENHQGDETASATESGMTTGKKLVRIYTDGAARGNPDGPGGYGTILEFTDDQGNLHTKELSQGYRRTTNNRMELMAAIAGLEALNRPCVVELYSDSKYLTDAFNLHWIEGWIRKGWKRGGNEPVKNISLWKRLLEAAAPHQVSYVWVRGHNGHPQNERCDQLATSAADSQFLIEDDPGE